MAVPFCNFGWSTVFSDKLRLDDDLCAWVRYDMTFAILLCLTGILTAIAKPQLVGVAKAACDGKLEGGMIRGLIAAIFCGVLMYAAVKTYAKGKTLVGIIFCIPTFILCGFEHSVADMYYFAVASFKSFDPMSILFVLVAIVGNTLGGWLLPVLMRLGKGKETENESK